MKNKNLKRLLSLVIAFMLILSVLVGCGDQTSDENFKEDENVITEKEEVKEEEEVVVEEPKDAIVENGIVSSQQREASKIGAEILEKGGNAIDAAVATSFALGVCEPNASGLGGGGFMTFRDGETGETIFIDFREVAPINASEDMYPLDEDGKVIGNVKARGGLSVAVPGEVKGLLYILEKYGTMSREEVIQPSIDLANNGYGVSKLLSSVITDAYDVMIDYEELGDLYLKDGLPYEDGDTIVNKDLAKTLEIIAEHGEDGFYKGEVAEAIVEASSKYDGIITMEDLAEYEIEIMEPITGTYRGNKIISSPPPSSGGTHLIQILNMMETMDFSDIEPYSADHVHILSELFKIAYADRAAYMGDTNYIDVPLKGLTNKEYAEELVKKLDMEKAQEYDEDDPWKYEGDSTTHLSVADKEGNMVGITKTINYYFGSGVAVDGYGFILNNEMDDFSPEPGGPNSVQPRKKPLSSMSPTIVLRENGDPYMVLGAPGGVTIFTQVVQVISNVVDFDMDIQEAINMPRVWDGLTDQLQYQDGIAESDVEILKERGHNMSHLVGDSFGYVQGILYKDDGKLHGGADSYNMDAGAVGY